MNSEIRKTLREILREIKVLLNKYNSSDIAFMKRVSWPHSYGDNGHIPVLWNPSRDKISMLKKLFSFWNRSKIYD